MIRQHVIRQQGYLLVSVLVTLFIISAISLMMSEESVMESRMIRNEWQNDELRYVTEAAMQHAQWQLQQQGCGPYSDLASTNLGNHSYSATITPNNAGGVVTTYNVQVSDDAWIKSDTPTQNYGNDAQLSTYFNLFSPTTIQRALYRFDIAGAGIPAGATIVSAVAKIFVIDPNDLASVTIHRITADWNEAGVSWDSINASHDTNAITSIPAGTPAGSYVSINITSLVQGWINGNTANQGIMLKTTSIGDFAQYSSKEYGNTSQRPQLEINITDGSLSNLADISASGTLVNGLSQTLTRRDISLYQSSDNVTIQPDELSGKDAEIWDQKPNNNYGSAAETWVSSATNDKTHSLFYFNTAQIPAGAKILSATLSVYHQNGSDSNVPVTAHRVTNAWEETSVSWNKRDATNNWNNAGGDYDPAAAATTLVGPASSRRYQWDLTDLVAGWVSGRYANNGVMLLVEPVGYLGERFNTSEHVDPTRRPQLIISYACQCGVACQLPAGSGKILFVVIDSANLTAAEQTKKSLFESWGYQVTAISQLDVDWNYKNLATSNDVTYVSNSVDETSYNLTPPLAASSIPVINEKTMINNDLGISSGYANSVGTNLNILDNSHYITALFPTGSMPIYLKNMEQRQATGTLAPDLQTLGDFNLAPALAAIETAGVLADGSSTAPARRVMLPIGRDASFNWKYLNNNGRLLVQRAIQWGVDAAPQVVPAKKIYWTDDVAEVIQRSDEDGSNVETVVSGQSKVRGLDIDTLNGKIYWSSDHVINRADLDGSNIETVYTSTTRVNFDVKLDVAGGKMYWSYDGLDNQIMRANLDGSVVETLTNAINQSTYVSLDIDNNQLYVSAYGNGDIMRLNFDGSGLAIIVNGAETGIIGSAIDTQHGKVYWSGGASNDWIRRSSLDGSSVETIITGLNAPQDIAVDVDNERIYFSEALVTPSIKRANADGSNVETIVSGLSRPRGIVIVNADQVPATACNGSFADSFNTVSYSNNDGSLNWSGDWLEINESDGAGSGDELVMDDVGHSSLRLRNNDGGGEGVEREMNLAGATLAKLGLLYRRNKLDDGNDRVTLSISSNGAAGPWTELTAFAGGATDNNYISFSADISDYISANTRIRLLTSAKMGNKDEVFFDDILIKCQP